MERRKAENKELYAKWRVLVYRRDGFTCQKCGVGTQLEAHHIHNFAEYPKLRYDVQNGITLCIKHHAEFHHLYGNEKNDEYQIEKYIGKKLVKMDKLF